MINKNDKQIKAINTLASNNAFDIAFFITGWSLLCWWINNSGDLVHNTCRKDKWSSNHLSHRYHSATIVSIETPIKFGGCWRLKVWQLGRYICGIVGHYRLQKGVFICHWRNVSIIQIFKALVKVSKATDHVLFGEKPYDSANRQWQNVVT